MPEATASPEKIPGVRIRDEEDQMLPYKVSESAGQALDQRLSPEDVTGKDLVTIATAPPPPKNTGFEKTSGNSFKPSATTPPSFSEYPDPVTKIAKDIFGKDHGVVEKTDPLQEKIEMAAKKHEIPEGGAAPVTDQHQAKNLGFFGKMMNWFYEDPKERKN